MTPCALVGKYSALVNLLVESCRAIYIPRRTPIELALDPIFAYL